MMTLKFFFLRGVGCPRNPPWSTEAQTCPGLAVIQDSSSAPLPPCSSKAASRERRTNSRKARALSTPYWLAADSASLAARQILSELQYRRDPYRTNFSCGLCPLHLLLKVDVECTLHDPPAVRIPVPGGQIFNFSLFKTDCLSSLACAVQKLFHP